MAHGESSFAHVGEGVHVAEGVEGLVYSRGSSSSRGGSRGEARAQTGESGADGRGDQAHGVGRVGLGAGGGEGVEHGC